METAVITSPPPDFQTVLGYDQVPKLYNERPKMLRTTRTYSNYDISSHLLKTNLHHERVGRVYKVRRVALGRALQTQLAVGGHRVVEEHDAGGQPAVVEDLPVVLAQLAALGLEAELVLKGQRAKVYIIQSVMEERW